MNEIGAGLKDLVGNLAHAGAATGSVGGGIGLAGSKATSGSFALSGGGGSASGIKLF